MDHNLAPRTWSDQEWHHEMPDYLGSVRCCGYFGQAALFSLTSFSLSSPCTSFVEVYLYFSKRNSVYKPPSRLLRLLLITFTVLLSYVLVSSCPQQIRGVFASASTDVDHPLPNGPPDLQTTSIMSTYHMKPPSQKVPTLCWIAGTHRNGCLRNQVSYWHHIKCPSNLKDLAVSQSGTYAWHTIGTLADSQIPLQFPTKYWFDLGPNFGGDGSLDHVYGGSFAMISTGSLAEPGHCPPVLLRAASLQRKRTLQRRRQ